MPDLTDDVLASLDELLSLMPDTGDDVAQEAVSDLVVAASAALTAVLDGQPALERR